MRKAEPRVYLIAETSVISDELFEALDSIGASEWVPPTDATRDAELLVEVAGRRCYRSYGPGLNPNVKRIRDGNRDYIQNLINQRHGSVLEHATATFMFEDVSRVFTHELVRHRVGTAISQESMRYVRLTDLPFVWPSCFENDPEEDRRLELEARAKALLEQMEAFQQWIADVYGLDSATFERKKEITSAARRWLPEGVATGVVWTANHRTIRHVLESRTSRAAEDEMRIVFDQVGQICLAKWPHIYGDFQRNSIGEWMPKVSKV